jgi:hypothetical protein
MHTSTERQVAANVERQIVGLLANSPKLIELPIAPLHGLPDLVRLELALLRFAKIHRSRRSKLAIRRVKAILWDARARIRGDADTRRSILDTYRVSFLDIRPAR